MIVIIFRFQFILFFYRYVLALALRDMNQTKVITEAPKDCDNSGSIWETGRELFNFVRKQELLNGETGKVAFDDQGDRIYASYNIINIQRRHDKKNPVVVGKYFCNTVCMNTVIFSVIFLSFLEILNLLFLDQWKNVSLHRRKKNHHMARRFQAKA